MRTLTQKEILIVQKINQLRDSLMSMSLTKAQTDFTLDVISRLNISLIDIANEEKINNLKQQKIMEESNCCGAERYLGSLCGECKENAEFSDVE